MDEYVRPDFERLEFRDDAGNIIDYGNRWAHLDGVPPEESYSVDTHPQRFLPLHTVAIALVDYLSKHFEVDVDEGLETTADLLNPPPSESVVRAIRLTPKSPASAPIVMVLTDLPGIQLHAGELFFTHFPSCGCDACDERLEDVLNDFEDHVFGVVEGGLTEEICAPRRARPEPRLDEATTEGHELSGSYQIHMDAGACGGELDVADLPIARLEKARARLANLTEHSPVGNWLRWPLRT